ncbi:LexA family transcriptional regulator [Orbaceae bacterium ac157xtp]
MKQTKTTFAQRLKHIIGDLSLLEFARRCNLSESAIRKYVRHESEPTLQNLLTMAEVGNVSVAWLATGEDPFHVNTKLNNRSLSKNLIAIPELKFEELLNIKNITDIQKINKNLMINNWILNYKWLSQCGFENLNQLAIVEIPYDNMSTTIKKHDVVIINLCKREKAKVFAGIYIFSLNNKILLKRLQYNPIINAYNLINDNPLFNDHQISVNDKSFHIIGKVEKVLTTAL